MKKRTGFKMKGYTYPGKSPVKYERDPKAFEARLEAQDDPRPTVTTDTTTGETDIEGKDEKTKKGIDWGQVGTAAMTAGAQGLTTLAVDAMKGKPRKPRAGNTQEGFMSQKFGTDTNILV